MILVMLVCCTRILLSFSVHRLRAPLDAFFQASRTQPHSSATSHDSETRNPVSDDLQVSGSSASDSDSSTEFEEGGAPAEEPEAVVLEGEHSFSRLHSQGQQPTSLGSRRLEALDLCFDTFPFHTGCHRLLLYSAELTLSQSDTSVTQSYPTPRDPMDCSAPGLPVRHQLPEFTQTRGR